VNNMIFKNDFNSRRIANYEAAIKNLEKAKELLNERYINKKISDDEYIKKSKEINSQIETFKRIINKD